MGTNRSVLQALKILGLEEMLKLSEVLRVEQVQLKKAAGADYIVWDDSDSGTQEKKDRAPQKSAKILPFPKKLPGYPEPLQVSHAAEESPADQESASCNLMESELILWQRDHARSTEEIFHKQEAFKGYKKACEVYSVKAVDLNGKEKIRFASTNGVLIDKKQA